jgi:predicted ATPase/class 3 adenylate cyclase
VTPPSAKPGQATTTGAYASAVTSEDRPTSRRLPSGTVTFLFTDVEGSTRLLQRLGDEAYAAALAEHRRLLRAAFAAHDGVEIDTQGDAFFVAFPTAAGALHAARDALAALADGPISVRIGVHTGTPVVTDEGYVGEDVHRAARIAASGYGGQVLVSASTAALVDPDALGLRDLGEHRFKDLAKPERVYQVGDADHPPIRSLSPSNLPVPATPFVGREDELARIGELLSEQPLRLLTLTGPGGTGKTRLAIQAAAESSDGFPGGLWWVPLAPLEDPGLVLSEVAGSIGVEEQAGVPLSDTIAARTAGRPTLVLLDNAEHLLPRLSIEIAPLTRNGASLSFLVTSRERLHLEAEREFPVPSMSAADAEEFLLGRGEALGIRLEPSPALSKLAERLDRLPLAMQLAAARLKLFSVEQLLERLSTRLDLPGARDADPRQRTLRATIEWSHDLLDEDERTLFRRLSVFAGGGTVEAVEAICDADASVLLSLVDKSLVRRRNDAPEPRFWMLETIREFAAERLDVAGETMRLRDAHARWLAERMTSLDDEIHLAGDRGPVLAAFDQEFDDVRTALGWALERSNDELLATLAGALRMYWQLRGLYREGRRWVELAYERRDVDPRSRIWVLDALTSLAYRQGEYAFALRIAEEAMPVVRASGFDVELGTAMTNVANALSGLDRDEEATRWFDDALEAARRVGAPSRLAAALVNRGDMANVAGRHDEAVRFLLEALSYSREHGIEGAVTVSLIDLATATFMLGRNDEAERYARESIRKPEMTDIEPIALLILAGVSARRSDRVGAARLLGASDGLRDRTGYEFEPGEHRVLKTVRAELGHAIDEPQIRVAYEEGRALEVEAARALIGV